MEKALIASTTMGIMSEVTANGQLDKNKMKIKANTKHVLALDMSGSGTGWAFLGNKNSMISGVTPFLSTLNPGSRWLRFYSWLEAWTDVKPDLLIYEEPIVYFRHKQGLGLGYAFEAVLHLFCAREKIDCVGVNVSSLKKWATGDGRADKFKMVRFARQIKPDVSSDDEADAILLLEFAKAKILKRGAA
jgi:crossover junction endodeoxyribonuclease RuvC